MQLARTTKIFIALIAALTLGACSSITVTTDFSPIDFSGFKTYAWLYTDVVEENGKSNDIIDGKVKAIVDANLKSKDFTIVAKDSADFYVNYNVTTQEKTDIKTYNSYGGYYPGYRSYGAYGMSRNYAYYDTRMAMPPLQEQVITEHVEGTLILDIVDPKTNKLVWRGTAGKHLDDAVSPEDREEVIREVVSKLLAQYPPK
ncbi:MAG: hypothetical protein ACJAYG_002475 [Oceanicoccus sp.]|jgi:hypothetical protein